MGTVEALRGLKLKSVPLAQEHANCAKLIFRRRHCIKINGKMQKIMF